MQKPLFLFLGLALVLTGRAHAGSLPEGCGDDNTQFKVKTTKSQTGAAPETGQAKIIFIQSLEGGFTGAPVSRFGVDGTWAGATRGASFFSISVPPGTHHLCASRQSSIRMEKENVGVATVNAEVGKVYVFEFKIIRSEIGDASMNGGAMLPGQYPGSMTAKRKDTADSVTFSQLDDEQGKARMRSAPMAISTVKN